MERRTPVPRVHKNSLINPRFPAYLRQKVMTTGSGGAPAQLRLVIMSKHPTWSTHVDFVFKAGG